MSEYQFSTTIAQPEFDAFVKNHELSNLLQSWNWSSIKSNWDSMHTAVYKDGKLAGTALVLIKALPAGFTMFYIPRGPIMDYSDQELVDFFFKNLKKEAKKRRALFIKMDPAIEIGVYPSSDMSRPLNGNEKLVKNFQDAGAIHQGFTTMIDESIQARFQSILEKPEDVLAAMPKKTKKLVKEAEKRHLEIISGRDELLDDFAALVEMTESRKHVSLRNKEYFRLLLDTYKDDAIIMLAICDPGRILKECALVEMTESRKHVSLRNKEYFRLLLDTYKDDAIIMLAICDPGRILKECQDRLNDLNKQIEALPENQKKKRFTLEEQKASAQKDIDNIEEIIREVGSDHPRPIAGVLTIAYGKTAEMLYAGMDERFRRFMPQYKTYLVNFQWAFDHGVTHFSMGGVEGTLNDGLTHFKDNFAPQIHELIGEFDLPVNKLLYKPSKIMYEKKRHQLSMTV